MQLRAAAAVVVAIIVVIMLVLGGYRVYTRSAAKKAAARSVLGFNVGTEFAALMAEQARLVAAVARDAAPRVTSERS